MSICRRQLAASLLAATRIADRQAIASFIADAATQPAPNPFPHTSAGAVRQVWRQRAVEFESFGVQAAGVACLLRALSDMAVDEALTQEILRAGPHTANVFHRPDGCQVVGAVLYGKPGFALPAFPTPPVPRPGSPRRARAAAEQLDLFRQAKP